MSETALTVPSSESWETTGIDQYQIELDGGQFITLTVSFSGHYSERGTSLIVQGVRQGFFGDEQNEFTWSTEEFSVLTAYRSDFRKYDAITFDGLAAKEITGEARTELLLKLITVKLEDSAEAQATLAHWAGVQPNIG